MDKNELIVGEPCGISDCFLKVGDKVIYIGTTNEQVHWGACKDPRGLLQEGETYTLERVDVHTWHTKLFLVEEDSGRGFNSASFKKVKSETK